MARRSGSFSSATASSSIGAMRGARSLPSSFKTDCMWASVSRRRRRETEAHMQSVLNDEGSDLAPRIAPMLDDAVAELNEPDRRAILLRFYEGRNLRDVGAALGASEDAAQKRLT